MPKFKNRVVVVEATQWQTGAKVEGVEAEKLEIHYSIDKKLYYITGGPSRPTCWLTTYIKDGPVPEDMKKVDVFAGQPVEFKHDDGRVWHRLMYPFSYWKVTSGPIEPADQASDLVMDFACFHEWKSLVPSHAYVNSVGGRRFVSPGEWIVKGADGRFYVYADHEFQKLYEPITD